MVAALFHCYLIICLSPPSPTPNSSFLHLTLPLPLAPLLWPPLPLPPLLLIPFISLFHPQSCREVLLVLLQEDSLGHLEEQGYYQGDSESRETNISGTIRRLRNELAFFYRM